MKKTKLKGVNGVYFGKSLKKQTPFIRILCRDEDSNNCSWTGWLTTKNADNIKDMLSHFKLNGTIEQVIEASPEDRPSFFSVPSDEVLIEENQGNDGKTYRSIQGMAADRKPLGDDISKDEIKEAWKKFDFTAKDITALDTSGSKAEEEIPF